MYRNLIASKILVVSAVCLSIMLGHGAAMAQEVNVYSARKEALILPLLEKFKAETGIGFNLITAKADELLKRLEAEGQSSPADVFITTDAGRLQRAKAAGVLRPVENAVLMKKIPANLRDEDNYWFGLSQRARVIFYARDRVNPAELSTYEALAEPKWKQRICIRSSDNIYNQSLVASMIEAHGIDGTEAWVKGLVANFARKPAGGDTDQLRAAAAGLCDIAIANTYYYGRLVNSSKAEDQKVANSLGVFWPNQGDRGTHVNVSGAAVTRHARHGEAAERLLEFLVGDAAQTWYAEVNNEYPVVAGAATSDTLKSFGEFKGDSLNLTRLGDNNRAAVQLMDRAGWR
jgi:iron(III) transport system substrate-binding protein